MDLKHAFVALGIALGLGLLVGMQRERVGSKRAGSRTFPLITLLGAVCALLVEPVGGWIVAAGLIGVASAMVVSNIVEPGDKEARGGITTEIAMLVMFGVGALCVLTEWGIATAVGGVVLLLLHAKEPLHGLARRLGEDDVRAIVRFALISLVVLPVLPDETYDPYDVLNPRRIWLVVVLVVGIGLAAYVAQQALGESKGALVGGLFGGMVSSTATTASMARRVKAGGHFESSVLVATIASAMVVPRQLIEIAVIAPRTVPQVALPLGLMLLAFVAPVFVLWRRTARRKDVDTPQPGNPAEIGPAVLFGLVFAVILFAIAVAEDEFGNRGLFVVSSISGLTDVDAITISAAGMVHDERIGPDAGRRAILLASIANLVFKAGIAGFVGGRRMLRAIAIAFAPAFVTGAVALAF